MLHKWNKYYCIILYLVELRRYQRGTSICVQLSKVYGIRVHTIIYKKQRWYMYAYRALSCQTV